MGRYKQRKVLVQYFFCNSLIVQVECLYCTDKKGVFVSVVHGYGTSKPPS